MLCFRAVASHGDSVCDEWSQVGGGRGDGRPMLQRSFQLWTDVYALKQRIYVTSQLGKGINALYFAKNNPECIWSPEDVSLVCRSPEMVKGKKVQVTSLSFAPRMWGYLKIRGDLDPGRCPLRGRASLHICYQTKAIVRNLHPDTSGGATERGPPDAGCQVLPPQPPLPPEVTNISRCV